MDEFRQLAMQKQLKAYWQQGNKQAAFALFFSQCEDWQSYCHKLTEYREQIEGCDRPEEFKAIAQDIFR